MTIMTEAAQSKSCTPVSALLAVIKAAGDGQVPVLMWGEPGVGKSALIGSLAQHRECAFEVVIGSQSDPTDFGGLPVVTPGGVDLEAPAWAKRLAGSENGGIAFLDELTTAVPATQGAMLRVVNDKVVGNVRLGAEVQIVAAANPPEHAADGWDLTAPMSNRFCHVTYSPNPEDWARGLVTGFPMIAPDTTNALTDQGIAAARAQIAGFIHQFPGHLHALPNSAAQAGRAWPSPRTWTHLATMLAQLTTTEAIEMVTYGLVGEGVGAEFITWRDALDLPDPADLIADPASGPWADLAQAPDRAYAALTAVVAYAKGQGTSAAWTQAWEPLSEAAKHGLADVAAACAVGHMQARPGKARPPASVKTFQAALSAAGLAA